MVLYMLQSVKDEKGAHYEVFSRNITRHFSQQLGSICSVDFADLSQGIGVCHLMEFAQLWEMQSKEFSRVLRNHYARLSSCFPVSLTLVHDATHDFPVYLALKRG